MRGTRQKLSSRGHVRISSYVSEFSIGDMVHVSLVSNNKIPDSKYQGRTGKIISKRGRSYIVQVADGSAQKRISIRPEHLKKQI